VDVGDAVDEVVVAVVIIFLASVTEVFDIDD
jgi:hypothetical protein